MRKHHLAPLLVLWLAAGASTAHAAVPVGDDGSLRPRDGAELLEAADRAATTTAPVRIVLGRGTFEIDRAIELDGSAGDSITGYSAGETTIRGAEGTTTLLNVIGRGSVGKVSFAPSGTPTAAAFPAIRLGAGALLTDAFVSVSEATENATAIASEGATLIDVEAESLATGAPLLRAVGYLSVKGASFYGGSPTVDVQPGPLAGNALFAQSFLTAGVGADAVLRVHGSSGAAAVSLSESIIRAGDAEAPVLVDLAGSTSPLGTTVFDAQRSTFSGPPESTTLRVTDAAQLVPTVVTLGGVLALGAETTVDCRGSALLPAAVTITGIYRTGEHAAPSGSCVIVETGRRSGGDPSLTTDRGLRWGSPAIDAIARPSLVDTDAFRAPRTSIGPSTPALTPTDLGALEYQYLPPSLEEVSADPQGDGTVRFSVVAMDGNEEETEQLEVVWRFPDGTTATGTEVTHRFEGEPTGTATVTATDPSGLRTQRAVALSSQLADALPGPIDPSPTPTPTTPEPTPTPSPAPSPTPQQTLPELVTLPKPSGGGDQSALAAGTAIVRSVVRTSPRARRTATRRSGLGVARTGEAGVKLDLASAANLTVLARRKVGTRLLTVPNARFSIDVSAGAATLHLTSRVGTATLGPGLYRFTILVRPVKGTGTRRDLFVRVLR